jgi:hypothetical protein
MRRYISRSRYSQVKSSQVKSSARTPRLRGALEIRKRPHNTSIIIITGRHSTVHHALLYSTYTWYVRGTVHHGTALHCMSYTQPGMAWQVGASHARQARLTCKWRSDLPLLELPLSDEEEKVPFVPIPRQKETSQ